MAKKIKIDIDFSSDNTFLAISCHKKDYWIAYQLNEALKFSFRRMDDLPYYDEGLDKILNFALFQYIDPDTNLSFYLLSNFNPEGKLFRALRTTDFFILIHGRVKENEVEDLLAGIKKIKGVLTAYKMDIDSIKDFGLFLSDLELHMVEVLKP